MGVVPDFSTDYEVVKKTMKESATNEANYEENRLNDEDASIVTEEHFVKIRKLDRNICNNLKRIYEYRCQFCGALITEPYTNGDEKVIDAHHIIPITQSCNNFSNIMILCPNHHRIIYACNPEFNVKKKEFVFLNGYHEKLSLINICDLYVFLKSKPPITLVVDLNNYRFTSNISDLPHKVL